MFKWPGIFITILILNGIVCSVNLQAEGRDPFVSIIDLREQRLAQKVSIDLASVVLKGIIWSDRRAVAIINDELVMVGEDWQGFKVERIDKDSVTINDGISSYKLLVQEGSVPAKRGLTALTPELSLPTEFVLPQEGRIHDEKNETLPIIGEGTILSEEEER